VSIERVLPPLAAAAIGVVATAMWLARRRHGPDDQQAAHALLAQVARLLGGEFRPPVIRPLWAYTPPYGSVYGQRNGLAYEVSILPRNAGNEGENIGWHGYVILRQDGKRRHMAVTDTWVWGPDARPEPLAAWVVEVLGRQT
jgi:hypothetical protein